MSNLYEDIVTNSEFNRSEVGNMIVTLKGYIKNANDAIVFAPIIKEYLDIGVKNDEQLIKLCAVVQRIMSKKPEGAADNAFITEDEIAQINKEVENLNKKTAQVMDNDKK